MDLLTREQITLAFERLNEQLARVDVHAELYLVGGAVMCLALNARPATKDVEAWLTETRAVREAARVVAAELSLPADWLNDAAKAFIPERGRFERWRLLSHLDISVADDRTLLAMKCAASRTAEDANDIRFIAARLGLTRASEVLELVLAYFPPERLPVRSQLLIEELFDDGQ